MGQSLHIVGSALIPSTKPPHPQTKPYIGIVFNEHSKVPIAAGALHDYGLPRLGHTSATVERYGLRYALPVSTNTNRSSKYKRPSSCPGLALCHSGTPAHWHSDAL